MISGINYTIRLISEKIERVLKRAAITFDS